MTKFSFKSFFIKYFVENFRKLHEFFVGHRNKLVLFLITYLVVAAFCFVRTALTITVSSYDISEYEPGQISDITIVAKKSLRAEFDSPVSVEKGEVIVKKGFEITNEQYEKLTKMAESPAYIDFKSFFRSVLYLFFVIILFAFLFRKELLGEDPQMKELVTECVGLVFVYVISIIALKTSSFATQTSMGIIIPNSFCSFLISILFGQVNAVFFSIVASLALLNGANYSIFAFIYALSTSLVSSFLVRYIKKRSDVSFLSITQAVCNVILLSCLSLIFRESIDNKTLCFVGVFLNGFISIILCNGFLTPLELMLKTASIFRLTDLETTTGVPVLDELYDNARGTWTHSLNVAQLARKACDAVGANSRLAGVAAIYHDIGKSDNPQYYTENQVKGPDGKPLSGNVHDKVSPQVSANIIRSHVKKSEEKAREIHLPERVVQIISEHHGNQVIQWAYTKAKELDPAANPAAYSYTGNPPSSKESAVVMLADTVEAACHSLIDPSSSHLETFITDLVKAKREAGQLDNCNLTFAELGKITRALIETQQSEFHKRTKYPNQLKEEAEKKQQQESENNVPAAEENKSSIAKEPTILKDRADGSQNSENDVTLKPEKNLKVKKSAAEKSMATKAERKSRSPAKTKKGVEENGK